MIEIPIYIKSINEKPEQNLSQRIPKTIIQTYNTNKIPELIFENIMKILRKNPEYDYRLITDEEAVEIIKTHFDGRTLNAFQQLILGAAKGDFIRYIVLYLYGGVYLDLDASIETDLNTFIQPMDEFIFFINGDINLEQFCFMIRPRHPILLMIIEEMVKRIENRESNIFRATGPTLFNDVIYNMLNNSSIYDTDKNLTPQERGVCYGKYNQFMGGKLILRHGNDVEANFQFRIPNAEKMIYENTGSISYFTYDPSSNIHYIYKIF
jgi:mannosyltransferase OCH1-like enzyme